MRNLAKGKQPINFVRESPFDWLPDSLLIYILSFLTLKEAAITSVLSKRWQLLWPNVPSLDFGEIEAEDENEDPRKTHRFVAWVNRTLAIRTTNYVESFSFTIRNSDSYFSDIDNWILYAMKNRVKKLHLMIHCKHNKAYWLPDTIYSSSSLEFLWVGGDVVMSSRVEIDWKSLFELCLEDVALDQCSLDQILSGCHVLHTLELKGCSEYYRLEIYSRNLHILTVEDIGDESSLDIWAPHVRCLDISLCPDIRLLHLEDFPSLRRARIGYNFRGSYIYPTEEFQSYAEFLLKHFQHAVELELNSSLLQVISILAETVRRLPQSTRRYMKIFCSNPYFCRLSGIMALLESSPNLETFVLEGFDTDDNKYYISIPDAKRGLDCDLSHLKTIHIRNFAGVNSKPMLTLARMLLSRATALENMDIVIDVSSNFFMTYQQLLHYPRASFKAQIVITQQ